MTVTTRPHTRAAMAVLVSAQFVVMLDTAVVNVALPSIQEELGLSQAGTSWVVNAYFLAFGGFLLLSGRAADLFGRRRMFMVGAALFTVTTLLAGFAPNEFVLVAARALQGLGAAILSPAALSIILVQFPGEQRGKAMGAWGAASAAGGAIGVAGGGLVTGSLGWPWVFFLTVPVTLAALVFAPRLFPPHAGERAGKPLDTLGAVTVTGGALAIVFAILSAAETGGLTIESILGLGAGIVLLLMFVWVETAAADPIVPLGLFRARAVSAGVVVGLLGGASRASTYFLSALYLQQVILFAPAIAGLAMVPTSVAGFVVSLLVLPRVIRSLGAERTLILGLVLLAAGHFWLARTPADAQYGFDVLPGLLLAAAGVALSFTPSTMVIASGIPSTKSGLASGLANASSQIGAAVGIAAFSAVAALRVRDDSPDAAALATGFQGSFLAAGIVALLAAAVALLVLKKPAS